MASTAMPSGDASVSTATAGSHSSTWAIDKDWTKHRALIAELYNSHTLAEVMKFMESEHKFKATIKMYKRRLKQWGADKNNKEDEMRAIVRKTKERLDQGKRSEIRVRGRAIDDGKAIRYWRRKGISIDDVIAHRRASVTPEAVEIITPVPSRVATPTSLAVPERIFAMIRDYFEGSFVSGNWVYDDAEILYHRNKVQGYSRGESVKFTNDSMTACLLFSNHRYREAGMILSSMTSKIKEILLAEDPETLGRILTTVTCFRRHRRDEIGTEVLRQFGALGEFVVGTKHPLRLICAWLASADAFQLDEIIARCFQGVIDQFENFVGPMHFSSIALRTIYILQFTGTRGDRKELLQDLLGQCELQLGSFDIRTHFIRLSLADNYGTDGQYAEALRVGQDLVAHTQHRQSTSRDDFSFYTAGLFLVADAQYSLGQMDLAEANLRKAIEVRISRLGARDSLARRLLVILEQWLTETGRWSSAAEVRETWMAMIDPADII